MAQSGGCPQEALGTSWDTAADCGLRLAHRTEGLAWSMAGNAEEEEEDTAADCGLLCFTHRPEDLAWLGTQKKKKEAVSSEGVQLMVA